ncbi:NUMOD4 domain-containing protein [Lysinibacillus fusiformis]|uniref:NUMOD4 domain-containing protein n=1 Tax=Lysinibacillus fusiformis TaxID=28031 RepID=UPI00263B217E|nr:NUMOD4 domain-containing protein [Lysinibacillus fusiformis]MDC6267239.1 NUMOD4 domain-containing protein [Lysinibacillus sphaericus]MDN4968327.1 NUMOD4 domain-containing protein [Lysinibacillus fusiformis]MDN4968501.1 NUMOD4 domain-containing protein [Lysinibacillus fusiformis]
MIEWRDIPDYEGIYEASTDGQIRTKEGKTTYSSLHGKRVWKSRVLKQKVNKKDNCCRVSLWKDKKEKTWLVHRLIAVTFLDKPDGKDYINHIDGNRLNNQIINLEWCDHTENNNHAFDNDLIGTGRKIVLVNKETKECHYFRSHSRASQFLGLRDTYISNQIEKGITEVQGFELFLNN